MNSFSLYIKALRPHQWTKNLIIFAPGFFAQQLSIKSIILVGTTFSLFCIISSGFYLINDLFDRKLDSLHPIKKNRPIASGRISIKLTWILAITLILLSCIASIFLDRTLGIALVLYGILQVLYNLCLKNMIFIDIMAISGGFVLRAYGGAVILNLPVSPWFLLFTSMLALYLALEKRKAEYYRNLNRHDLIKTRTSLQLYSISILEKIELISISILLLSYSLWSFGPILQGSPTPWMMITIPILMYGVFRYQLLSSFMTQHASDSSLYDTERPSRVLLNDRVIISTLVIYVLVTFLILRLNSQGII
jgi:decaprenyl-phosphate phosphoribosyltransferase